MRKTYWFVLGAMWACSGPTLRSGIDAGIDVVLSDAAPPDDATSLMDSALSEPTVDAAPPPPSMQHATIPYVNPPLAAACDGKSRPGRDGPLPNFQKQVVQAVPGAGYIKPYDLDGDGYPELMVTALTEGLDLTQLGGGPPLAFGGAYLLAREGQSTPGTLGSFVTRTVFNREARIAWPNASTLFDIDNDGLADWVIGGGFLTKPEGSLVWMKRIGATDFGPPQRLQVPDAACWYHEALPLDMDGDQDLDFVTSCHVGNTSDQSGPSRLEWFENPGDDSAAFVHHAIGMGGGALLTLFDLDGDGDQDIIAPQFFEGEALVWFEHGVDGQFTKHVINDTTGRGFVVRLSDINGDGRTDLLYGNHNNELAEEPAARTMGIYWFEIPTADTIHALPNWDAYRHTVYEGFEVAGDGNAASAGAPGMLNVGDLDGDCDIDVTASGDGDLGLYAFVQGSAGFTKLTLDTGEGNVNSGEQHVLDLDDDGDADIVWAVFGSNDPALVLTQGLSSKVYAFLQQ